jgi:hypothetical protein
MIVATLTINLEGSTYLRRKVESYSRQGSEVRLQVEGDVNYGPKVQFAGFKKKNNQDVEVHRHVCQQILNISDYAWEGFCTIPPKGVAPKAFDKLPMFARVILHCQDIATDVLKRKATYKTDFKIEVNE